jgi:hypothetical protein
MRRHWRDCDLFDVPLCLPVLAKVFLHVFYFPVMFLNFSDSLLGE